jgi:hypothetical protein
MKQQVDAYYAIEANTAAKQAANKSSSFDTGKPLNIAHFEDEQHC